MVGKSSRQLFVAVVVDDVDQVLGQIAVIRQCLDVFGMGFQREHQQPQRGDGVVVHGFSSDGSAAHTAASA